MTRLCLVLLLCAAPCWAAPNIVLILADDLGYGDLGCYGQEKINTPRIDEMAEQGLRFTRAYAGSTVCAPSRCALMTGRHMGQARIRGNADVPLAPEDGTVAEILQNSGYTTGLVGKWGLGLENSSGHPNRKGFDYFYGFLDQTHAHTYYPAHLWRNEAQVPLKNVESRPNVASERIDYAHDLFTKEALKFLQEDRDAPFFLYLAYTIPHVNNERQRHLGDGMEVPELGAYEAEDWPRNERAKAAMISRLDRDVGRLLDALRARGIAENTLVLFTSDNGPHREGVDPEFFDSNGALRGIKRDLYEGGIRVPFIAWWPGTVRTGTSAAPIAFWDIPPTAQELAGAPGKHDWDGMSFAPLLRGISHDKTLEQLNERPLYWEFHEGSFSQAVMKGPWKLLRPRKNAALELYNLEEDPAESRDLAGEKAERVESLAPLLESMRTPSPHWPTPAEKMRQ